MDGIQLCSDAKFTNIAFTNHLVVNNSSVIDNKKNITCNDIVCNTLYYNTLIDNYEENPNTITNSTRGFVFKEVNETVQHDSSTNTFGGHMNECDGEYSIILGGQYNECASDYSVVLGGSDNQCHEPYSVVMGTQGIGAHSNIFLWNGSQDRSAVTTMSSQCMLVSDNGLMFSVPESNNIMNSQIPEGMSVMCWDSTKKMMCVRSCQHGEHYKSFMTTLENHVRVQLVVDSDYVRVVLHNTDGNTNDLQD